MSTRTKALRKLKHAMLYLMAQNKGQYHGSPAALLVREKYQQVRGPYDFRQTGHSGKCCKKYT